MSKVAELRSLVQGWSVLGARTLSLVCTTQLQAARLKRLGGSNLVRPPLKVQLRLEVNVEMGSKGRKQRAHSWKIVTRNAI